MARKGPILVKGNTRGAGNTRGTGLQYAPAAQRLGLPPTLSANRAPYEHLAAETVEQSMSVQHALIRDRLRPHAACGIFGIRAPARRLMRLLESSANISINQELTPYASHYAASYGVPRRDAGTKNPHKAHIMAFLFCETKSSKCMVCRNTSSSLTLRRSEPFKYRRASSKFLRETVVVPQFTTPQLRENQDAS